MPMWVGCLIFATVTGGYYTNAYPLPPYIPGGYFKPEITTPPISISIAQVYLEGRGGAPPALRLESALMYSYTRHGPGLWVCRHIGTRACPVRISTYSPSAWPGMPIVMLLGAIMVDAKVTHLLLCPPATAGSPGLVTDGVRRSEAGTPLVCMGNFTIEIITVRDDVYTPPLCVGDAASLIMATLQGSLDIELAPSIDTTGQRVWSVPRHHQHTRGQQKIKNVII